MAGIKRDIIFRQVLANLNSSPANYAGATSVDEAYDDLAVMDAILNQEAFLLHKIAESWFNGNRTNESGLTDIISSVTVANGALIPRHIGPVIGVLIDDLPAEIASAVEVARLRTNNPLKLKLTAGLYGLQDNRLFFTTNNPLADATVYVYQFVRPTYTNITNFKNSDSPVPAEYQQAWVDLSTGAVIPREGAMMQASQMYINRGMQLMGEVEREHRPRPFAKDAQMGGE
jgi:hypothetical protein